MTNKSSQITALGLLCLVFCQEAALSNEGLLDDLEQETEGSWYSVVLDMACLDSDFQRHISRSDAECTEIAKVRLEECKSELKPILPSFGIRARMERDPEHKQRVTSASFALIYCIQARASFEPPSGGIPKPASEGSEELPDGQTSDFESIRSALAQIPRDAIEDLFHLAKKSDYLIVTKEYGDTLSAVTENDGKLPSTTPSGQSEWSTLMSTGRIGAVYVDDDRIRLQLGDFHWIQGVPVFVEISNEGTAELPTCLHRTPVRPDESGACGLKGAAYNNVEVSWLPPEYD